VEWLKRLETRADYAREPTLAAETALTKDSLAPEEDSAWGNF
jgi:hypothetical protein